MAASPSFQRLSRAPLFLGARASSSISLARSDASQHKLSVLQRRPLEVNVLPNGVRVITQRRPDLATATVGLFRRGGSEQETRENNGISGVFQRVQQRGTQSRSGSSLASAVAGIAGRVSSVSERQYNGTLLRTPTANVGEGISLLADMARNPLLSEEGISQECERSIQALEAAQYDMDAVMLDNMHNVAFQGTSMALSPLGNNTSLRSINRDALQNFAETATIGQNLCLVACGDVDHAKVLEYAEKQLGSLPAGQGIVLPQTRYTGSYVNMRDDDMALCYTGIAVEAPAYGNADSMAMEAARHIIGSYDRSYGSDARHGLCKGAFSAHNYQCRTELLSVKMFGKYYSSTGLWGMLMVSPLASQDTAIQYCMREWHTLRNRCREADVDRAKCDMRTELGTIAQDPSALVNYMARQQMTFDRVVPLHEMDERIENLKPEFVRACLDEYFYDNNPVYALAGQSETSVEYMVLQRYMHRYRT